MAAVKLRWPVHFESLLRLPALVCPRSRWGSSQALVVPSGCRGWWGVVGVAVFQAAGTPLYMVALARIGALKAGMVTNIQPVTAIFEAWVLFGEVLSALQAIGGAMVLIGIGLMQWIDLHGRTSVITQITPPD